MHRFTMNGDLWRVRFVHPDSSLLIDRTGRRTVATTDPVSMCVNLSSELEGAFLRRVLLHELGHCALISFGLLDDIRSFLPPDKWVAAEEWVCNIVADYGDEIYRAAYNVLGEAAWRVVELETDDAVRKGLPWKREKEEWTSPQLRRPLSRES